MTHIERAKSGSECSSNRSISSIKSSTNLMNDFMNEVISWTELTNNWKIAPDAHPKNWIPPSTT